MRIENLRSEQEQGRARVSATVIWEDNDRPTREVFFETDQAFAEDLSCNPHAFLVGCIVPAWHHGEERIAIDATICPELRNGLLTSMGWLCKWAGSPCKPLRIEARPGAPPRNAHTGGRRLQQGEATGGCHAIPAAAIGEAGCGRAIR